MIAWLDPHVLRHIGTRKIGKQMVLGKKVQDPFMFRNYNAPNRCGYVATQYLLPILEDTPVKTDIILRLHSLKNPEVAMRGESFWQYRYDIVSKIVAYRFDIIKTGIAFVTTEDYSDFATKGGVCDLPSRWSSCTHGTIDADFYGRDEGVSTTPQRSQLYSRYVFSVTPKMTNKLLGADMSIWNLPDGGTFIGVSVPGETAYYYVIR